MINISTVIMFRLFIISFFYFYIHNVSFGQVDSTGVLVGYEIINGDTLLVAVTNEASIIEYIDIDYRNSRKYIKTLRRVKKVYPYATLASDMYTDYLNEIDRFDSKGEKRKYLKGEEKELKKKFEGKIRDITVTEGIILIKLIDRQTGYTGYEVLQDLKGNTSAFLWQGVSRIFDSSLKYQYDPTGEDWMIEEIVQRIRSGEIAVSDMTMN